MMRAAEAGVGVAVLPDYVVSEEKIRSHKRMLPQTEMPEMQCFLVYPRRLKNVARIEAFRDFLVRAAQRWRY